MRLLLISPENVYATQRLQQEALKQNIDLEVRGVKELASRNFDVDPRSFDALYIRQAYTEFDRKVESEQLQGIIGLTQRFQDAGKVVVDQVIAEDGLGQSKHDSLQLLQEQGIAVPQTDLLSSILIADILYPVIAKWNFGFGAKHTYLVKSAVELKAIEGKYPSDEIMIQQFVPAEFEYETITVGYKALPAIIKIKTNHNKFLPDRSNYEIIQAATIPAVAKLAETSAQILQRELAKTDILEANGQFYVLEVNRWPGFQYFEKVTGVNVAGEFLSYISGRL